MRSKIVACMAVILIAFIATGGSGCEADISPPMESGDMEASGMETIEMKMIKKEEGRYILENDLIYVEIDENNGQIAALRNKDTGLDYIKNGSFVVPVRLDIGENRQSVAVDEHAADTVALSKTPQAEQIVFTFNELYHKGSGTGINCVLTFSISPDEEYIKYNVSVGISEEGQQISRLVMLDGSGFSDGSGNETLTAPTWGGGTIWDDPFNKISFKSVVTLGYPGQTDISLESGYISLYAEDSGIGIAYINTPKIAMEFDLDMTDGMRFRPRMFNPSQIGKSFGGFVPLEPGASFQTGDVVIAAHSGDWHKMADIYRAEYQKAFVHPDGTPDYLTWEDISQTLKDTDFLLHYAVGVDGKLVNTFEQIYDDAYRLMQRSQQTDGVPDGSHTIISTFGANEDGYGGDIPTIIPCYPAAGGTEGAMELARKVHELGCSMAHYNHPFAVDPDGAGYFASTDPLQWTAYWNLCYHQAVCIDNDIMMDLWRNRIIPDMNTIPLDCGVLDQCSLQQTVCDMEGHNHELDAVSRLGSHIKAVTELCLMLRENIASESPYLVSENGNDLTTRYVDLWSGGHGTPFGGRMNSEMRQYTFPQYISNYGFYNDMPLSVCVTGRISGLGAFAPDMQVEFVRFRNEIREAEAPGFPYGFRDNVGLSSPVPEDELYIKVFTDGENVTLTYTSAKDFENVAVTVDFAKIGIEGGPLREVSISNEKDKCGFVVLTP